MAKVTYEKELTALLMIDPYNDFIFKGGEVTMVKDATADYSDEEMHAALNVNIPNYASAIVTTTELVDSISGNRRERFL